MINNVEDAYTGGFIGYSNNWGDITACYATGDVTNIYEGDTGGFIAFKRWGNTVACYATGDVQGKNNVGGFIGLNYVDSYITNSYATGNVTGEDSVGGFVGHNYGDISTSYTTANVSGNSYVGAFIGETDSSCTLTDNYWSTNATQTVNGAALADSAKLDIGYKGSPAQSVTGLTLVQMQVQSNFSGWDFTTVWSVDSAYNGGLPYLLWQTTAGADALESIALSQTSLTIRAGVQTVLLATATPNTVSSAVTWKSSDQSIATVSASGVVQGVAEGTATITATSTLDASKSATCTVTVQGRTSDEYQILALTVSAENGTQLEEIPQDWCYLEVAVQNISAITMDNITIATYDANGAFIGLQYMRGSIAVGECAYFGCMVNNSEIATVKAFVFETLGDFTPLCAAATLDA